MAIYISKNGQQLGPYSIADAQNLVRSGNLLETDWAWYEGLANWIPLNQIPGFVSAPPPAPVVPAVPVTTEQPQPSPGTNKNIFQKMGGGIAALAYAAFKFKAFAFAGLKTSLSMLLMIWSTPSRNAMLMMTK